MHNYLNTLNIILFTDIRIHCLYFLDMFSYENWPNSKEATQKIDMKFIFVLTD